MRRSGARPRGEAHFPFPLLRRRRLPARHVLSLPRSLRTRASERAPRARRPLIGSRRFCPAEEEEKEDEESKRVRRVCSTVCLFVDSFLLHWSRETIRFRLFYLELKGMTRARLPSSRVSSFFPENRPRARTYKLDFLVSRFGRKRERNNNFGRRVCARITHVVRLFRIPRWCEIRISYFDLITLSCLALVDIPDFSR